MCANTRQLRAAIQKDVRIVVTDLTEDMLHLAIAKFEIHENTEIQTANTMHLPFDDSELDAVVYQFSTCPFQMNLPLLRKRYVF